MSEDVPKRADVVKPVGDRPDFRGYRIIIGLVLGVWVVVGVTLITLARWRDLM